ncbi:MAG: arylsulfatase [Verrucomicrobiales bacterium]|nr:arylsulfatase [Verrucomicrobiales bacterium]
MIVILADDLGYGDVGAYNSESQIATPAMDRLAAEGMRFTDAHSPSAVCTPTRYGLLTGRYCWRTRLKKGVLWGIDPALMDPERATVADLFKKAGYATACIGKWHLGFDFYDAEGELLPNNREYERTAGADRVDYSRRIGKSPQEYGFDQSFVITGSLNMFPYTYIEGDRIVESASEFKPRTPHNITIISGGPMAPDFDFEAVVDVFAEKAEAFVRSSVKNGDPFFLYYPLTAPHKPVLPAKRFQGKSGFGIYGDFILQVDDVVARIDQVLEETGRQENTLIVVTSDNGSFMYRLSDEAPDHLDDFTATGYRAENHQSNYHWRGTKADIYEAGHRVPMLVRWPAVVEAGTVSEETVTLTDWYRTFAAMLSQEVRENEAEDSISLIPLLTAEGEWQRPPVVHHSFSGMFAIRDGDWKLIAGNGSGGRENPKGKAFERPYQLYNLKQDPSETKNLIEQHPEIAERLEGDLEQIRGVE